jgi:hypothetical protein
MLSGGWAMAELATKNAATTETMRFILIPSNH